jgi:hypothetical protein
MMYTIDMASERVMETANLMSWVRFLTLPNFLQRSGSGTGSTQPRENK